MRQLLAWLLLTLLSVGGCTVSDNLHKLETAASCIKDNPDSAYALLSGVDTLHFLGKGEKAHYYLLLTEALDRLGNDGQDDRRISFACNYYKHHGNGNNRLKAWYYLGVTHHNAGRFLEAQQEFRKAEELAVKQDDFHHLGLIYWHMSRVYSKTFDLNLAVKYMQKSVQAYDSCNEKYAADFSRLYLSQAFLAQYQLEECKKILYDLIERYPKTDILYAHAQRYLADALLSDNPFDYEGAAHHYEKALATGQMQVDFTDIANLAIISQWQGNGPLAQEYLNTLLAVIHSPADSILYYDTCYNVFDLKKNYRGANKYLTDAISIERRTIQTIASSSVSSALSAIDYETAQKERAEKRAITAWLCAFALFFIVLLCVGFTIILKRNRQLEESMAQISDFKESLEVLSLRDKGVSEIIRLLVQDKIDLMEKLSNAYFAWDDYRVRLRDSKQGLATREEVIDAFRKNLEDLRSNDTLIPALQHGLSVSTGIGITDIRTDFRENGKDLSDTDIELLTLFFAGMPNKGVSFLCNMSGASVRMRKTRFRQQIERFPESIRGKYLALLH